MIPASEEMPTPSEKARSAGHYAGRSVEDPFLHGSVTRHSGNREQPQNRWPTPGPFCAARRTIGAPHSGQSFFGVAGEALSGGLGSARLGSGFGSRRSSVILPFLENPAKTPPAQSVSAADPGRGAPPSGRGYAARLTAASSSSCTRVW